jgi:hypothetical protein
VPAVVLSSEVTRERTSFVPDGQGDFLEVPGGQEGALIVYVSEFFGAHNEKMRGPQGFLAETPEGYVVAPHFHEVDQFQICFGGGGVHSKHVFEPISVQYANSSTPYGPTVPGPTGLVYYVLRPRADGGYHFMPGSKHLMTDRPRRSTVLNTDLRPGDDREIVSEVVRLLEDDDGLMVEIHRLEPGAERQGPSPADGSGQYYLVVNGTCELGDKTLTPGSLAWVDSDEPAPVLRAGASGLEALIAQFPQVA